MSTRGADAAAVSEPHPATASGGATTGNAAVCVASGPSTHDDGTTGAITGSGDGPDSGTVDSAVAADAGGAGSADGSGHAATPAGGGGEGDNNTAAAAAVAAATSQGGDVVAADVSVPGSAGAGGIARDSEGVDGAAVGMGSTDASGQDDQASGSEGGAGDTGGSDGDVVDTPTAPADGVQVPVSGGGGDVAGSVASVSSRGAGGHNRGTSSDAASGNSEAAGSGAAASNGSGDEEFVASTPCDRSQDASSDDDDAPPLPPHGVRGAAPSDGDEAEPGSGSDDDDGDDDDDAGVVPPSPADDAGAAERDDGADASAAAATAEACVDPFRDSGLSPAVQPPMAPTSDVVVTVAQMLRSGHRPPALSEPSPHRAVTGSSRRVVSDADVALQDVDLGGGLSSIDLGTGTGRATAPAVERVRAEAPVHVKRRSSAASLEGKAAEGRSAFRVASGASMGANTVASGSTHRRNGSDYMGALVDVSLDDIGGPRVARTEHTAEFVAAALPGASQGPAVAQ